MEVCRLAHTADMCVERQRVVDYDAEALDTVRRTYFGICDGDDVERTLGALSSAGADHNGFRLVGVSDKPFSRNQLWTARLQSDSKDSALVSFKAI